MRLIPYAFLALSLSAAGVFADASVPSLKNDSVRTAPAKAKAAADDPYGVSAPATQGALSPTPAASAPDTVAPAAVSADTALAQEAVPDSGSKRKPRPKVTRETTVNTMDAMKGRYRSPKKALFMSLLVPGLGQAYVGQSAFNYGRAVVYLGTDVTLGLLWYQYVVVKHDRKVSQSRVFADKNWSQGKYEDSMAVVSAALTSEQFKDINIFRETYCDAVQSKSTTTGNTMYQGCLDPKANASGYSAFASAHDDENMTPEAVASLREGFPRLFDFYELVGKEQEFIAGWRDAQGVSYGISGQIVTINGTSALRDEYIGMRATANRYARMQAWFLGGIVVNHIVSALDAALSARQHNKGLYQTETRLWDRLHLDGGLAFDGASPRTRVAANFSF